MYPPPFPAADNLFERALFQQVGIPQNVFTSTAFGAILIAALFMPMVSAWAMLGIWWERKVAGRIQCRHGPNRVGPVGLLQSIADGIKLVLKEDLQPGAADGLLFRLAPYLALAPVFIATCALPFGPEMTFEPRLSAGVFWIFAILGVEVLGVILAGWASNNKWSVYGAMREACQMISYEIPLGISVLTAVLAAGTLNLIELGHLQSGGVHTWLMFRNPFIFLGFFVFYVASLAANKRAPFDLPESESELVAGYHTEYSGIRFSFFFFAEYMAMFVIGGIAAAIFMGAWNDPFGLIGYYHSIFIKDPQPSIRLCILNLIAGGVFTFKMIVMVFIQMWLRWTLPRPRIDQVLHACIKVLLPLACVLLLGSAVWTLLVPQAGDVNLGRTPIPWTDFNPLAWSEWSRLNATPSLMFQILLSAIGVVATLLSVGYVVYCFFAGGDQQKRLTEPVQFDPGVRHPLPHTTGSHAAGVAH